jgi:CheY-like chemotaxis protein
LRLVLQDDFDVIAVSRGEAVLQELAVRHVDLILLDLLMPGVGGWDVFERVQELKPHRPRIIFLTAIDSSVAAVAALKLGADDWILKPFDDDLLLARLRAVLSEKRCLAVRGGDLGTRATIGAVALSRGVTDIVYAARGSAACASDSGIIDATGATTPEGLAAALALVPCHVPLQRTTARALHHVRPAVSRDWGGRPRCRGGCQWQLLARAIPWRSWCRTA